jgi:hypothetical protein
MQPSPDTASNSLPSVDVDGTRSGPLEDLVYQAMTVAAIVVLLCSLWVF